MENYPYAKFELLTSSKFPGVVFMETLGGFTPLDHDTQVVNIATGELWWFETDHLERFNGSFESVKPLIQWCKRHAKKTFVRGVCSQALKQNSR